jgi:iron complex outermembrane recepter protein
MFRKSRIGAAAALVAVFAFPALAQQDTQRIEIVGSNIKRVASEGALPVTIISRDQIERSGASTVAELLQNIGAAGQRGFETQASSSFTPGAAAVGLRGLSAGDTLVLLNGRRIAPYASASQSTADGAIAFVDLNSLPVSAIDSIQILKDGASAVYGADAVAGVINIVTRRDYRGFEVGTRFGKYEEKGGDEVRGYVTAGFGDFGQDRFNVLASLEVTKKDAIFFRDRDFFRTFDHRAKAPFMGDQRSAFSDYGNFAVVDGDGVFRRGTNCPPERQRGAACRYDFGPVEQLAPDENKVAGLLLASFKVSNAVTAFAEAAVNKNTVDVQGRAPAMDTSTDFFQVDVARNLALGTTRDALRAALAQQVPGGLLTVPNGTLLDVRTRFTDFGPRDDTTKVTTKRLLAGLRGTFGNWDWETAYAHSGGKADTVNRNEIRKDLLADLIVSGQANVFGINKTGYQSARYVGTDSAESTLKMLDGKVSGEIAKLGGGAVMMAIGLETRKEEMSSSSDEFSSAGLKVGSAATGTVGSRDLKSGYVEFLLPLTKQVELTLAGRYDKYSDFGNTTNPKVGLRFQPSPQLLLRGSYGTAFKAPTLFQLYEAQAAGGFQDLTDTVRCAAFGGQDEAPEGECDVKLTETRSGGVKSLGLELKPEESKNLTLGLVFEPSADTNVSVDYWRIKKTNAITQPAAQQLIDQQSPAVIRNPTVNGIPGTIVRVTQTYFNAFEQDIEGIDIEATRRWRSEGGDKFTAGVNFTYLTKFDETRDDTGKLNLLGNYDGAGANPRIKGTATFRWDSGNWSWYTVANYIHDYRFTPGLVAAGATQDQPRVPANFTLDANVTYSGIKNMNLRVGVRNALGEDAPLLAFFPSGTDTSQYDSRGRFWYMQASYAFK